MSKAKNQKNFIPKNAEGPHKFGGKRNKKGKHQAQFAKGAKPKGKVS